MTGEQHIYIDNSYSKNAINKMKEKESNTLIVKNFLLKDELQTLQKCISTVRYPEVGKTSKYAGASYKDPPYGSLLKEMLDCKLQKLIGEHELDFYAWQEAILPWKIHADLRWYPNKIPHKVILIPLDVIPNESQELEEWPDTYTITFKQRNYLRNNKNTNTGNVANNDQAHWSFPVNNPNVENLINGYSINKQVHTKYMSHMPYEFLEGLELDTIFKWEPGSAVCWDQTSLHCADNFLKNKIKTKLSLIIFSNQINPV